MMDCLNEMVGIISPDNDCPCLVDGLSDEIKQKLYASTSGKFIESLEDGLSFKHVKAAAGDCNTFASYALEARDKAVEVVKDALIGQITEKFSKAKKKYIGNLGHPSFSRPYDAATAIVGMRIKPNSTNKDSQIVINTIQLATFSPITTTVKLIKAPLEAQNGTIVGQWPVTTTGGVLTFVDGFTTLTLPLFEGGRPLEYFIVYDRSGVLPMDIQPTCNCPGVNEEVGQYVKVQGVELSGLSDLPGLQTQFTGGIVANVIMQCRAEGLICSSAYDSEDPVSLVLANSIMYKAGEILIEKVQESGAINRLTMMGKEHLWGKRNRLRALYEKRMEYIGDVIDISASDCFICKQVQDGEPTIMEILV